MVRIGIAIVEREGLILVGTRGPDGPLPGLAEFPGGKCHEHETAEACAVRECLEETGLVVESGGRLMEAEFSYPHGVVHLSFIECRAVPQTGTAETPLQGNFRWHPRADLGSLEFPEGNRAIVRQLLERSS